MPHLYVVRHAEPAVLGAVLGQCDPPLSRAGREQAEQIMREISIVVVYSSPLRRARETAELLARGAKIEIVDDLREITYGDWDGRTWAEIEAREPEIARRKMADWHGVTPVGGECWDQFVARVKRAFEHIKLGPRPAAMVAHAAVNLVIAGVEMGYGEVREL
jgi:broad specificity phosphatase PhoE